MMKPSKPDNRYVIAKIRIKALLVWLMAEKFIVSTIKPKPTHIVFLDVCMLPGDNGFTSFVELFSPYYSGPLLFMDSQR